MSQRTGLPERHGPGERPREPVRIGILIDGPKVPGWQAQVLRLLVDSGVGVIRAAFVPAPGTHERRTRSDVVRHWAYYAARATIWRPRTFRREDIGDLLAGVTTREVRTTPARQGWQAFPPEEIQAMGDEDLDVLLRFGFNLLSGDVLTVARYGMWSFHHGDERHYRGRPAGFWELHDGSAEIGVILQRLTERLDAGLILRRATVEVDPTSYAGTLDRVYTAGIELPLQVCVAIIEGRAHEALGSPSTTTAPIRRMPGPVAVVRVVVRLWWASLRRMARG